MIQRSDDFVGIATPTVFWPPSPPPPPVPLAPPPPQAASAKVSAKVRVRPATSAANFLVRILPPLRCLPGPFRSKAQPGVPRPPVLSQSGSSWVARSYSTWITSAPARRSRRGGVG